MKITGVMLLLLGAVVTASAQVNGVPAPEIDASSAFSALALLSGGLLILASRRKK